MKIVLHYLIAFFIIFLSRLYFQGVNIIGFYISSLIILILAAFLLQYRGKNIKTFTSIVLMFHAIAVFLSLWWMILNIDFSDWDLGTFQYPLELAVVAFLSVGSIKLFKSALLLLKDNPLSTRLAFLSLIWLAYPFYGIIAGNYFGNNSFQKMSYYFLIQPIMPIYVYVVVGCSFIAYCNMRSAHRDDTQFNFKRAILRLFSTIEFVLREIIPPFFIFSLIGLFIFLIMLFQESEAPLFHMSNYIIFIGITLVFIHNSWKAHKRT